MSDNTRAGVIGCGLMGSRIAEVCARVGLDVIVREIDQAAATSGRARIEASLDRAAQAGKLSTGDRDAAVARLTVTTCLDDLADRDLVIEAAPETLDVEVALFKELDQVIKRPDAIVASTTSSIPIAQIAQIAQATSRPAQVVGMHFFKPAPVQQLVELIPSILTSEETAQRAHAFATVTLGCAHPVGQLRLADLIGLDTLRAVADSLYDEHKEPLHAAPPLLRRMTDAGQRAGPQDGPGLSHLPRGAEMTTGVPAYAPSEEHELLRQTVRDLADAKISPAAADIDETGRFPQEASDALAAAGLNAVHIPEAYGGEGGDALATVIVIEEVARACAASSLIPAVNKLGTMPLLLSGSEELKQRYLPPVARGEAMFSYALSEAAAGSDAAAMATRAVRDGDHWILNGTKMWITNAGVSQYYTVMAVTDPPAGARGISAFVVEKTDPGVSFGAAEKKLGIKGSPTRAVIMEDARIPADRIIGAEGTGFKTALATLDHTRITIAAQALGIAQGALDYATGYVKQRQQFGQPVAGFQGVQFMVADMAMKLEAARQLTYHAAAMSERAMHGENSPGLTFASSAAKCFASDAAMAITTDAVQLLGGYGYVRDYPVERMMRDAKITQIYEGTNQIQRVVMARQIMT